MPLFIFVLVLVLAIGLLRTGLRGYRQGTSPHCLGCDYDLTGLPEGLCPECGQPWTSSTVVIGDRRRRPRRIAVGSLLALGAGLWFAAFAGQINYCRLLPTRLLLMSITPSGHANSEAINEVVARLRSGSVPADLADQFFRRIAQFELKIRPRVIQGEPVPSEIEFATAPVPGLSCSLRVQEVEIDGQPAKDAYAWKGRKPAGLGFTTPIQGGHGSIQLTGNPSPFALSLSLPDGSSSLSSCPAGYHKVRLGCRVQFAWGSIGSSVPMLPSAPMHTLTIPLEAGFQVLPPESADPIKTVRDASLKPVLLPHVQITDCSVQGNWESRKNMWLWFNADSSPVDLAFEIIFRIADKEYPFASVTVNKNGRSYHSPVIAQYGGPIGESVDVILRSSTKVARQTTTNLSEIWEGELVFPNVPVKFPGQSQPATTQAERS